MTRSIEEIQSAFAAEGYIVDRELDRQVAAGYTGRNAVPRGCGTATRGCP